MSRARDIANYGDGIDATQITSGVFANGRIQASNVTQHEGSIDALASNPTVTLGSNTTFGSGVSLANATFPAGHIVQIVTGERKLRSTVQSTSPTQTDLQATITPSSTSNKIQVFVTGSWGITGPNLAKFRLYKKVGGSAPANAISGTSDDAWQILQHQIQGYGGSAGYSTGFSTVFSLSYLDSPLSTEALLYELYFYSDNASPTVHFNSRPQSNNAGYAQITLMEIVA